MTISAEQAAQIKGKTVLMLSHSFWNPNGLPQAGVDNIAFLCHLYKDNGAKIVLVTPNTTDDKVYHQYKDNNLIDDAIAVPEMYGETAGQAIAAGVKAKGGEFHCVFSHFEQLQPLCGEVAELIGVRHNPLSAYANARDKYATRVALEKAGVPTPKSIGLSTEADIPACIEKLGFPMILKPTSGAGSLGVYKAFNEQELKEGVARVLDDMKTNVMLAGNVGVSLDAPVVVEQLLIAKDFDGLPAGEFDVDLIVWEGELLYGMVTDNWSPIPPYYLENGNNYPSCIPKTCQDELIKYCHDCVKALGFFKGVFHMEALYTETGPMLIECNPRVGGGPVVEFNRDLMGVNLFENFCLTMINVKPDPKPKHAWPTESRVVYYLNCPVTGKLSALDYLDPAKKDSKLYRHAYFVKEGDEVRGYDSQVPQWIGEFSLKDSVDNLIPLIKQGEAIAKEVTASVKVEKMEQLRRPSRRHSNIEPNEN